jgi:hypothetical protein
VDLVDQDVQRVDVVDIVPRLVTELQVTTHRLSIQPLTITRRTQAQVITRLLKGATILAHHTLVLIQHRIIRLQHTTLQAIIHPVEHIQVHITHQDLVIHLQYPATHPQAFMPHLTTPQVEIT